MKRFIKITLILFGLFSTLSAQTTLTATQLNATLGIVTNFILDDGITFRGKNYNTVTSPYTGRTWLDRNLGADRVCTSIDDAQCYGDYYQWGRVADGHQELNSSTTSTPTIDTYNAGSSFITVLLSPFDWASIVDASGITRASDWSVVDGGSVCPSGFRVPTLTELEAELTKGNHAISNNSDAFNSFLKLPSAGYRSGSSGALTNDGVYGVIWSSSLNGSSSGYIYFGDIDASSDYIGRSHGHSVRCIKSSTPADTMPPVISIIAGSTDFVFLNDNYVDTGAVAVDNVDVNLTVTSLGEVNTLVLGDYNITYSAIDSAGNIGKATKTVHVIDSITRNGISYGLVVSPYTGKVWLDRNMGASRVCTGYNDTQCYGDYYQWGRYADGHEDNNSNLTTILATDVSILGNGLFIASSTDWASTDGNGSIRSVNWSKSDGTSVCPTGFRVPSVLELSEELFNIGSAEISNRDDAFASFLKLPSTGSRYGGNMDSVGSWGYIWSSSVYEYDTSVSYSVNFDATGAYRQGSERAGGMPVRCIKD